MPSPATLAIIQFLSALTIALASVMTTPCDVCVGPKDLTGGSFEQAELTPQYCAGFAAIRRRGRADVQSGHVRPGPACRTRPTPDRLRPQTLLYYRRRERGAWRDCAGLFAGLEALTLSIALSFPSPRIDSLSLRQACFHVVRGEFNDQP
jgi:hypothetical protein